ncbi:MAG: hypothetical protein KA129_05705 [Microthrixaceae bacterium]|nr:hypothetical protein [Microthrixaceae bacterium]
MATLVLTSATTLQGTAWTGTAPGPANPTVSGTISSSTDWSDHIKQVSINLARANVDFTNFGSGGFVENKPGLANMDVTVSFFNDFAAANIDATFGPAALAGTLLYFDFKPTSASRAATNPSYVCALYIASYPPLGAQVGGAAETQIGFMLAGKYARLTS